MDIRHVVVLMLENNSFDRMLGWMPGVNGVDVANPRSNPNLAGAAVAQKTTVTRQMKSDPAHDLSDAHIVLCTGRGQAAIAARVRAEIVFHQARAAEGIQHADHAGNTARVVRFGVRACHE